MIALHVGLESSLLLLWFNLLLCLVLSELWNLELRIRSLSSTIRSDRDRSFRQASLWWFMTVKYRFHTFRFSCRFMKPWFLSGCAIHYRRNLSSVDFSRLGSIVSLLSKVLLMTTCKAPQFLSLIRIIGLFIKGSCIKGCLFGYV